jgi:excisionase family DNA binding protein
MSPTKPSNLRGGEREALFVRIPATEAQRLDRAAFELRVSKQDIVSGLVARYVDPASPSSLDALRAFGGDRQAAAASGRRITIETGGDQLAVGHHDFRPSPAADVLTLADVAALLQVDEDAVLVLAESGELPARRVGDAWRFARAAVLGWLGAGAS